MEYLSTYGFALLIIAVISTLLYILLTLPPAIPSSQCNFNGYINCRLIVVGSNSHSTRAVLLFSNPQQYQLENVSVAINITGIGVISGKCSPNVVISGGDIECVINSGTTITQNQLANGAITVTATVCTVMTGGCSSPVQQTYSGSYTTHINPLLPPPNCNMTLAASNATEFIGIGDTVTANVKLLGYNIAGATVNFTSNKTTVGIQPQYSNTDSNGNATSTISSQTAEKALIKANYTNCSASTVVDFVVPVKLVFADNIPNTGYNVLSVDSVWYSSLP
ncbi:MAG TPA: Ig-like domain-containing protein, partial [Candidatus Saccharimonadales bacterium]|nr:Ig-like domain-containing protein [Candidatus Saccharimonadales bacterium]